MKQNGSTLTNITKFALVQLLVLGSFTGFAQDDEKFGSDPDKCKESISLYREYYKQKNYDDAMPGWRWAFNNCPMATKNIVINGPKMIKHFIKKNEENTELKKAYVDTLMMVYDKRIELYPKDKGYVLGRKGMDQYKYVDGGDYTEVYNTLREALSVGKTKTEANAVLRLYQSAMKRLVAKTLEMDVLYDLYEETSMVIEHNLAKGEESKGYKYYLKAQEVVDKNFEKIAKEDQYIALMQPKVEAAPTDTSLLEKVTTMMVKRKWTSNPFYIDVSEKLYKLNPSSMAAYNLYEGHLKKGNTAQYSKFLQESIKLDTDNASKAEKLLKLAKFYGSQKSYSKARSTAQEAASLKSGWGAPHIYIADLYMSTSNSCGKDACSGKYGYWAATDLYSKAKRVDASTSEVVAKKLGKVRTYYPTTKDCFFLGIKAGDTVTVGGWISVNTTARFAD